LDFHRAAEVIEVGPSGPLALVILEQPATPALDQ